MILNKILLNSLYGTFVQGYHEYMERVHISRPVIPPISSDGYRESMAYHLYRKYLGIPELSYTKYHRRSEFAHDSIGKYYNWFTDELMDDHSDGSYPELMEDSEKIDVVLEFIEDYTEPCHELYD